MVLKTDSNPPLKQRLLAAFMLIILGASLSAAYAIVQWRKPSPALMALLVNPQRRQGIGLLERMGFAVVQPSQVHLSSYSPLLAMSQRGAAAKRMFCLFQTPLPPTADTDQIRQAAEAFEKDIINHNPGLTLAHESVHVRLAGRTLYSFENVNTSSTTFVFVSVAATASGLRAITYSGADPWTLTDAVRVVTLRGLFLSAPAAPHDQTTRPAIALPPGANT